MIRRLQQLSYVALFLAAWLVPAQAWIAQKATTGAANDCSGSGTIARVYEGSSGGGGNWGWASYNPDISNGQAVPSGSNQVCLLFMAVYDSGKTTTSVVWNTSEAFTLLDRQAGAVESGTQDFTVWYIKNPTSGTHTFDPTFSSWPSNATGLIMCYSGVNQTSPINAHTKNAVNTSATTFALSATATGGNNCWASGAVFVRNGAGGSPNSVTSGGAGTSIRTGQGDGVQEADSDGTVTAGTVTLNYNYGGAGNTTPGAATVILAPTP